MSNPESSFRNAFKNFGARSGVSAGASGVSNTSRSTTSGFGGRASNWFGGVQNQVSGYVPVSLGGSQQPVEESWLDLTWFQRMAGFSICIAGGLACFMIAQFYKSLVDGRYYSYDQIPDLTGKVALITGANQRLGYDTTLALVAHGAHAVVACRTEAKANEAIERLHKDVTETYPHSVAAAQIAKGDRLKLEFLDGIAGDVWTLSADGIENHFASRLENEQVFVNIVHPGVIKTNMGNTHTNDMEPSICTEIMKNFASAGAISVEDGALTQLYCATSPEVQNKNIRGKFFIPIAHELDPMPEVESKELQEQLWTYSEEAFVTADHYSYDQIPNLTGKYALVTGANQGIGYATTLGLVAHGAHVVMACRSEAKANEAIERLHRDVTETYPHSIAAAQIAKGDRLKLEFLELDLNDLKKVQKSAQEFLSRRLPLHILVNNSGVGGAAWGLSADGIENHFAINHLGHFVLTTALLDCLKESQPSRVVVV
ncbi:hypothetical protein BGZ52_001225, partial [Haplosporangium bisporale]